METKDEIFTAKQLRALILPLFMEQLLVMLVGLADTFVISYAGEAAVSGVSLVNQFNTIFLYLFSAMAAGGAVVISQYIGHKDNDMAGQAAGQLFTSSFLLAAAAAVLVLALRVPMLRLLFGRVEPEVMEACLIYLCISALSFPALAVYNTGAALYRSMGRTNVTMYISLISNLINIVGNLIGVFVLHAGVAGVAWPSLLARVFSAVAITVLCFDRRNPVFCTWQHILCWKPALVKKILGIAIPNGVENGVFQLVKVALSSIVALFGTVQIAANGVAQSIWSMAALAGVAMGPVFITVIGQCMGAGDIPAAERYFVRLTRLTLLLSFGWNLLVLLLTPPLLQVYALSPEAKTLVFWLVVMHNCFNAFAFPISGGMSNGLRAAGDVRFTMVVAVASTIGGRLVLSYLFAVILQQGVLGIAAAMCADWVIRAVIFWARFRSGKWKQYRIV